MRRFITTLALAGCLLTTSGCAAARQFATANPEASGGAAIAVEGRAALGCVTRPPGWMERLVRLRFERIAFDALLGRTLNDDTRLGVDLARAEADALCPSLPAPDAVPAPAAP